MHFLLLTNFFPLKSIFSISFHWCCSKVNTTRLNVAKAKSASLAQLCFVSSVKQSCCSRLQIFSFWFVFQPNRDEAKAAGCSQRRQTGRKHRSVFTSGRVYEVASRCSRDVKKQQQYKNIWLLSFKPTPVALKSH